MPEHRHRSALEHLYILTSQHHFNSLEWVRTTVRIDDDVLNAAKSIAASQGRSLGAVLTELARRGLQPRETRRSGLVPVFDIDAATPPLTPEMVREALDDAG
jgi:hypothetical protein